jgi:hypothetical protein
MRSGNGRRLVRVTPTSAAPLPPGIERANTAGDARHRADREGQPARPPRTFAALRCVAGDDPAYTAEQIGHEDAAFTLRVYTSAVKRRQRLQGAELEQFDRALEWARMGTIEAETLSVEVESRA